MMTNSKFKFNRYIKTATDRAAKIRAKRSEDNVRGVICGDCDIKHPAGVFYNNESKSWLFWGRNDAEIIQKAESIIAEHKANDVLGKYTDDSLWEIRIYD